MAVDAGYTTKGAYMALKCEGGNTCPYFFRWDVNPHEESGVVERNEDDDN